MEFDLYGFRGQEQTFLIYGNGETVVTALQNLGGNEELGFTHKKSGHRFKQSGLCPLSSLIIFMMNQFLSLDDGGC